MEKDPTVQGTRDLGSMHHRPSTPKSHDITLRVPSEGTLLNVHTIKDKSQILYFNLLFIVNIMNTYFTYFVRVNGHFMALKHL